MKKQMPNPLPKPLTRRECHRRLNDQHNRSQNIRFDIPVGRGVHGEWMTIIEAQRQSKGFPLSRRRRFLNWIAALFSILALVGCSTFEASLVMPGGEVLGRVVEKNYIFASRQQTDFVLEYSELDESKNTLHEIKIGRGTAQDGDGQRQLLQDLARLAASRAP